MLFDDALASESIRTIYGENWPEFQSAMMQAQRFDLSQSFATAADEIVIANPEAQFTARRLVRPPYDITWWEVPHLWRPSFSDPSITTITNVNVPHRVGILVQTRKTISITEGAIFRMDLFYSTREMGTTCCPFSMIVDSSEEQSLKQSSPDNEDSRHGLFSVLNPYLGEVAKTHLSRSSRMNEAVSDWHGEIRFWPVSMMLLNSKNVAYSESLPAGPKHKANVRKGRSPLTTFQICKIKVERVVAKNGVQNSLDAAVRAHFVRGHFKVRKHGAFWWRPHLRGDISSGFAIKTYVADK